MKVTIYNTLLETIHAVKENSIPDIYISFNEQSDNNPPWTVALHKEERNLADFWEKDDAIEYAQFKLNQLKRA